MHEGPYFAQAAALIGDPARATMLAALMREHALTASELASISGITPQTASSHIRKLSETGLVRKRQQGRHHYIELSGPDVAHALEALMVLTHHASPRKRTIRGDKGIRRARTCYDHIAGHLGVQLMQSMVERGEILLQEKTCSLSPKGEAFFKNLGVDLPSLYRKRRVFAIPCLDWSERQSHLGGALGAALLGIFENRAWICRHPKSRMLAITPEGSEALTRLCGIYM